MSDSDCSNCDKNCKFRDYSYDCYVNECLEIKNNLTEDDYKFLLKISKFSRKKVVETINDSFNQIEYYVNEVIYMYKEELDNK